MINREYYCQKCDGEVGIITCFKEGLFFFVCHGCEKRVFDVYHIDSESSGRVDYDDV